MPAEKVLQGTCIWFDRVRSLGFVLPDSGDANIFVYYKNIVAEKGLQYLEKGDRVEYSLGMFKNRVCAVNVKKLPPVPAETETDSAEAVTPEGSSR